MSARKIAYNTIAQVAGKFIGFFISSFFLIILASHLGTYGMGLYTTVTAFVAFFVNVADLGVNLVMMREIAQNPEKREEITGNFLGLRLIYSFAIMALAPLIAMLIPQYGSLIIYGVAIAALAQFLLLINQTFVSVLQVSLQLDRAVFGEIVNRGLTFALVLLGTRYYPDMAAFFAYVLWVTVLAAAINMVISYFFARRWWLIRPRFDPQAWQAILKLVIPMGLFSFLSMVHFKSDTVLLSLLKSPYDVGIYGYAYKIGEIMFSIPMMFIGIVFPQMSALLKRDHAGFIALTEKAFQVLIVVSLPFIAGIFILAPFLTTLLSRQSVADGLLAGHVLQILTLAMLAWFFGALYQHILLAGASLTGLIRNISIAVVINLVLNLVLIPHYSYFAAATTTVVTEIIMLVLTVVYVQRSTGFRPTFTGFVPAAVATVVMSGLVWLAIQLGHIDVVAFAAASRFYQLTSLAGLGLLGAAAYGAVLVAWGKSSPIYTFYSLVKK